MKQIIKGFVILFILIGLNGCQSKEEINKLTILSTSFPGYDFARAITKESDVEVKMLLKPGSEMHDYEPTPQDIKNIRNSNIFIYVGGDSDNWIEDVLEDIDLDKTKIVKLMDLVNVVEEEHVEGMEEHHYEEEEKVEYDEHVWTSPVNAIIIINKLKDEIKKLNKDDMDLYEYNANNYVEQLKKLDREFREIVETSKRKELLFGDRFPLRYFVMEYGLSYYAAFPGCSEQTEASAKTLAFLIQKVKEDTIPVIFKIELTSGKIAEQIAKETGAKVLEFHTAHNISQKDFEDGLTMVDIMRNNAKVLKEALN